MNTGFWAGLLAGYLGRKTKILRISRILRDFTVSLATEGFLKKNIMSTAVYVGDVEALQHKEVFLHSRASQRCNVKLACGGETFCDTD